MTSTMGSCAHMGKSVSQPMDPTSALGNGAIAGATDGPAQLDTLVEMLKQAIEAVNELMRSLQGQLGGHPTQSHRHGGARQGAASAAALGSMPSGGSSSGAVSVPAPSDSGSTSTSESDSEPVTVSDESSDAASDTSEYASDGGSSSESTGESDEPAADKPADADKAAADNKDSDAAKGDEKKDGDDKKDVEEADKAAAPKPASADASKWVTGDTEGLNPDLLNRLATVGERVGEQVSITSGHRTYQEQERLYAKYKAGTGNLAAKPGTSNHESGDAADVKIRGKSLALDAEAKQAALDAGLHFPVKGEPWHIQIK